MSDNELTPFKGKPLTREVRTDGGAPVFTIMARAPTPFAVKCAHRLGLLSAPILIGGEAAWLITNLPQMEAAGWVALATAPFLAPLIVRHGLILLCQRERIFRISAEAVEVKTISGWRRFDLNLPVRASLVDHDREKSEAERVEYINRKWGRRYWWFPRFRQYFNKSRHLSIDHLDQRNDVMTIYGRTAASRIAARINACIDVVRSHGRPGQGAVFEARDDWSRQPGEIIDID